MRYVSTRHDNCCAIASLAMITNTGYDRIRKLVVPKSQMRSFKGTTMEKALKALSKLGKQYKISFRKISLLKLKNNAYISVNMPGGCRHAIIWNAKTKRIMDPDRWKFMTKAYVKKNLNFIVEILE